jgi:tRNA U34 5-methylaminomethyl-2-thiouridine-forming methyltransferase MnmC
MLAVDICNRSGNERQLEAFIVHMSMGWLKLLQARAARDGDDLYIRDDRGRRIRAQDSEWLHKPLRALATEFFPEKDPRLANLVFFISLRNRIEHRYEQDVASLVAGRTQALLLNYETTLVDLFGTKEGLSSRLHFPLFLSSITEDATEALKAVRARVLKGVQEWLQDFDAALEPDVAADQAFDFRIYMIPHTGPKSEADAAMTFVRLEELTEEQRATMQQVQTIIRDKQVPVSDLGALLPSEVAKRVAAAISRPFNASTHHARAWRHYDVRPPAGAQDPAKTKSDFCRWNPAFRQYVYTEAWVKFLIRKLSDEKAYREVMGAAAHGSQ